MAVFLYSIFISVFALVLASKAVKLPLKPESGARSTTASAASLTPLLWRADPTMRGNACLFSMASFKPFKISSLVRGSPPRYLSVSAFEDSAAVSTSRFLNSSA